MYYTIDQLEEAVARWGEVFVVLDSDREYELHGTESFEVEGRVLNGETKQFVTVEGLRGDEWLQIEFPVEAVEHVYSHKEV